jgi:hypothetical protein
VCSPLALDRRLRLDAFLPRDQRCDLPWNQALLVMAHGCLTALGALAYFAGSLLAEYLMPLLESSG